MKHVLEVQILTRRQLLARFAVGAATVTAVPVMAMLPFTTGNPVSDDIKQSAESQRIQSRPFVLTF